MHTNTQDLQKLVARAKIGLMQKPDSTFFAVLCCSLPMSFSNEISTAATDGESLFLNPDFFTGLSLEERITLLAHETLHVAYLHALRKDHRDHKRFNAAADYVINLELKNRGYRLPSGGLVDRKYAGLSSEQVYDLLEQENKSPKPDHEDLLPPNMSSEESLNEVKNRMTGKISSAAMSAELSGDPESIPGNIRRFLEDLKKPKVNWRAVLQRFLSDFNKSDYSWKMPNRRYLPNYLPKLQSQSLTRIDFAIDTSGSISEQMFMQLCSELHAVLRMFNPQEIGVIQFDSRVQGQDVVRSLKDLAGIKFSGGGGTNVAPALEAFEQGPAQGLIVLTDGQFYTKHLVNPKRPVIWAIYDNPHFEAPFGQAIHFKLEY